MSAQNTAGITQTGTILDRIVARKVEEVAALNPQGFFTDYKPLDFAAALRRDTIALIAEIKHASPSKGILMENFDPVALAKTYAESGAAAISVLTDRDFFQGSIDDLKAVRAAVNIPIIRKDFMIHRDQITEASKAGADAILLIVAILDDAKLEELRRCAALYGLSALIEVHSEAEVERALKVYESYPDKTVIGINNRDLHTFKVDLDVTYRLASMVPPDVTLVSESGIFTVEDVGSVATAGAHAILVGESIVKSPDIGGQVRALSSVKPRISRRAKERS